MTVGKGSRAFGDGEDWEQGPGNGQETAGGKKTRGRLTLTGAQKQEEGQSPSEVQETESVQEPAGSRGQRDKQSLSQAQGTESKQDPAGVNQESSGEETYSLSVEESFEALEALIGRLESGEGSLEDAFKDYEEGMRLVRSCNAKIERIEKQVLILSGEEGENDVIEFH